jgi:hypothetical protein
MESGKVVLKYENGTYVGQVINAVTRHGRGVMKWTDGNMYEGEYRDGKRHGRGCMTWTDGSWYAGEWRDGCQNGRGVALHTDGRVFDGVWADDFPLFGTAKEASGALYFARYDGRTAVFAEWQAAVRVPAGRVVDGQLPRDTDGRWHGTVEDAVGVRYTGDLRWLRPCGAGMQMEGGACFRVEHADDASTLAEGEFPGSMPTPACKEVEFSEHMRAV